MKFIFVAHMGHMSCQIVEAYQLIKRQPDTLSLQMHEQRNFIGKW